MVALAVLAVCLYLGEMGIFGRWLGQQSEKNLPESLPPAIGAFAIGGFIIFTAFYTTLFPVFALASYAKTIALLFSVMYALEKWQGKWRLGWLPLVCFAGTYVLKDVFPELNLQLEKQLELGLIWSLVMATVMFFDRLPLVSFLIFSSWTFAFTLMSCLTTSFPASLTLLSCAFFVPLWPIVVRLIKYKIGCLGPYGSGLLGYIMGAIIALCMANGAYGSAITLMSYYFFEGSCILLTVLGGHPLGMAKGEFAFGAVLMHSKANGLVKILFYHLIILALISVVFWSAPHFLSPSLAALVILLHLYIRFRGNGAPTPTIKEMYHETVALVKDVLTEKENPSKNPTLKEQALKTNRKKHVSKPARKRAKHK